MSNKNNKNKQTGSRQEDDCILRVCIAGAGFAGAILGRQLQKHNPRIKVTIFERAANMGDSETSTGLNLNPNGLAALKLQDPELEREMRAVGLPRRTLSSRTTTGKVLYNIPLLSENDGLRIRWRDASTVVRRSCPGINYNTEVIGHAVDRSKTRGGVSVTVRDARDGSVRNHSGFDLLIGSDGRYSFIRAAITGEPEPALAGVCNYRVLVKDTSNGLFDDMEFIYNESPDLSRLPDWIKNDSDVQFCFDGFPRWGVLKMPVSETSDHESIYIFGNFPVRDQVPAAVKRADVLRALYAPSKGTPDAKTAFLLDVIDKYADTFHWARMQYIPFVFNDETGRVLLLGDSAHAMVPSLGLGATGTIEGACFASREILRAVQQAEQKRIPLDIPALTRSIAAVLSARSKFISETSLRACEHLRSGVKSLDTDVLDWTSEDGNGDGRTPYRNLMRQVWNNYLGKVQHGVAKL